MATKKLKDKKLKEKLVARRSLVSSLETVEAFVENYEEDRDFQQVAVWLDLLDQLFREHVKVQADLEKLDSGDAPLVKHLQERREFESRFCAAKGWLLNRRVADLNATINAPGTAPPPSTNFHLRLPKIDLPKFDGDYSRWLGFRDTFKSMVHDAHDIPLVAKLQFLLQSLEGDARKPFETVDIVGANYVTTWEALLKRYDNKRFLKKQLYRTLHDLPPIRKESAQDLHNLVDEFQRHVKALGKLGEAVETWDTPLVCMLSYKIDPATLRAWEEHAATSDDVGYEACIEFLYQRVRILQTVSSEIQHRSQGGPVKVAGSQSFSKKPSPSKAVANTASTTSSRPPPPSCIACSEKHLLFQCPSFQGMAVGQRRELISQKRLCWNCFKSSHVARNCDSKHTCRHCHERHHSLLHQAPNPSKSTSNPVVQHPNQSAPQQEASNGSDIPLAEVSVPAHRSAPSTVFLATVALWIKDRFGKHHSARALIDSGSQSNFISKKLARRLCLRPERVSVPITGIGEATVTVSQSVVSTILSKNDNFSDELEFLVIPKPTAELPSTNVDVSSWNIPTNVALADPTFNVSGPIDLLLGSELLHEYLKCGRIFLGDKARRFCSRLSLDGPSSVAEKFWELEAVEPGRLFTAEEASCEELFESTTTRNPDGRYVVRLPRTDDSSVRLGGSRDIAEKRLLSIERRLQRNETTKAAYHEFMDEYLRLGHMRRIADPPNDTIDHCYLPHHAIFKTSSTTTKTRVVFDASCRTASGQSLNDTLLVGPVVQEDLLSIVMRFRSKPIALVADIEKMYRQIEVHPEDQPLQRILWRKNPADPISTYELRTVTYGTASAPYLATRTLKRLSQDEGEMFPLAKTAVAEDFYVDDFISGAEDVSTALQVRRQTSAMLSSAGFPLRKWASNSPEVLAEIPEAELGIQPFYDLSDSQSVSTLGLVWEPSPDILRFNINLPLPAAILSRRIVLSYIAQIYDPLGLVGPVISAAKQYMQRLWSLTTKDGKPYSWDQPLPEKLQQEWKEFHATLNLLREIQVPRFASVAGATCLQLHFFSDASEKAYGACVYVRSEDTDGNVSVQLLAAKSKVAPLKTRHTINRLELCGALLSTQLYKKVIASLKTNADVFFWVDSTTVLQWLKSPPSCWRTFVGNRVSSIQESTIGCPWNHVPGKDNPADDISRGLTPGELLHQDRWWTGPEWLKLKGDCWPNQPVDAASSSKAFVEERKQCLVSLTPVNDPFSDLLFSRYSSYTRLRRVMAYVLRYKWALHASAARSRPSGACASSSTDPYEASPYLTASELQAAERSLCRLAQRQSFPMELSALNNGQSVDKSSPMKWIKPEISNDGLIRVGGRIRYAEAPESMKHPIVLTKKHRLAFLLADHYHRTLLHAGPQLMMTTMKQKFWLLGGRDLLRQVYHQCHTCFRRRPSLIQQATADLPSARVSPSRPFAVSGVDYCGPVYLRAPHRRASPTKAYIAVFVCFSTRAAALKRFVARRGKVSEIHSDNATNYKGAANELNQLYKLLKSDESSRKLIFDWCANSEIAWKFIPPRAPHFGGLWEAAVKSTKNHLLKEVGNTTVSYEEMLTLLNQVEMCLNSRPITELSNDPSGLEALTPGHFLVGANLQAIPEKDLKQTPDNRLNRWQLVQKRLQAIWKRWSTEYLQQLQARSTKGIKPSVDIRVGRLVIVKDDNAPPAQWPLGRIVKVHPGPDGIVRVVTLRTSSNDNMTRPVTKLAFLPMPADDADDTQGDM
ncbi:uncharacterized protein LOC134286876 [Aedes albopictus]|uniref:Integrase catalytic domain-containing protein n=1 Tax=Aedes albopictus TaxID=7160 RepID=A0ABM1Z9T9_AEDAL